MTDHTHDHDHGEEFPAENPEAVIQGLSSQLAAQVRHSLGLESALVETRKLLSVTRRELSDALVRIDEFENAQTDVKSDQGALTSDPED